MDMDADNTGTLEQSAAASMVADGKNEYKALLRPQGSKALKGGEPDIDDQQQGLQTKSTSNSFISAYEAILPIPKDKKRSQRRRSRLDVKTASLLTSLVVAGGWNLLFSIDVPTEADFSNDSMHLRDIVAEMAHTLPRTMLIIQQRYDGNRFVRITTFCQMMILLFIYYRP